MTDQSFDTTQSSSNDKLYMHDGNTRPQYPQGQAFGNPYPETAQTPIQSTIDQRNLSSSSLNSSQRQPSAKIDGDQMPRPLKLLNSYGVRNCIPEKFHTLSTDFPPSAGVPYIQIDEGQSGPKFMRSTVIQAPIEQSFIQQSSIPFGICMQPLAEMTQYDYQYSGLDGAPSLEVPQVDHGEDGPFRCHRCKAYVNPHMQFIEGGTKANCNLCKYTNDVPVNYQSQLNEFN